MSQQFDTIHEQLEIVGNSYKINRIGDIDKLFDALLAKGSAHADVLDEKIPYWAELWPSAIAMSTFLLENIDLIRGKSILEIGCGLGLPTIVAGNYAASIRCTDYIVEAIQFAKENYLLNHTALNQVEFNLLDWRESIPTTEKYDIIIASDVAYERKAFDDLEACILAYSHADSIVLLSEPNRHMAVDFLARLKKEGKIKSVKSYAIPLRGLVSKVELYILQMN
ncbi:MAG: methyltransferase domain-containing protein [Bacteroidota bacterium]